MIVTKKVWFIFNPRLPQNLSLLNQYSTYARAHDRAIQFASENPGEQYMIVSTVAVVQMPKPGPITLILEESKPSSEEE